MSSSTNRTKKVVPEADDTLDKFKYEVAAEVGVKNIFKTIAYIKSPRNRAF